MLVRTCDSDVRVRVHAASVVSVFTMVLMCAAISGVAHGQTFTVLHTFTGKLDGGSPYGGVVRDRQGNVYGTASGGGRYGYGVMFKIDASGTEKVLHSFILNEGASPMDNPFLDATGNVYATTNQFGYVAGTVVELFKSGKLRVLHRFLENKN